MSFWQRTVDVKTGETRSPVLGLRNILLPCTQLLCGPQINGKVMFIIFGCQHSSEAKPYQVLMNKFGLCGRSVLLSEMFSGFEVFQGYF